MKRNILYSTLLLAGLSLMGVSCGGGGGDDPIGNNTNVVNNKTDSDNGPIKNPDDNPGNIPDVPVYPTFETPNWNISNIYSFEKTMTLSVVLPDSIKGNEQAGDRMAVFCNTECRGMAERVEVGSGQFVWMGMVYGDSNSTTITFKYYSSKTKHLYTSVNSIAFTNDKNLGSIDKPEVIGMRIVTE